MPAARRPRRGAWLIAGAVVAGLCLCAGLCATALGTGIFKAFAERSKVESVLDQFMSAMAEQDTERAYELFSARARRNLTQADVESLLTGNNFVLFDGYRRLKVEAINLSVGFDTGPDGPQGTVASVQGTIDYAGGITGTFDAVLEQDEGQWRVYGINVSVPPAKFDRQP